MFANDNSNYHFSKVNEQYNFFIPTAFCALFIQMGGSLAKS